MVKKEFSLYGYAGDQGVRVGVHNVRWSWLENKTRNTTLFRSNSIQSMTWEDEQRLR